MSESKQGSVQGGVHAHLRNQGRVWVESVNSLTRTAIVRLDPGEGVRSRAKKVLLDSIDFGREWRFK